MRSFLLRWLGLTVPALEVPAAAPPWAQEILARLPPPHEDHGDDAPPWAVELQDAVTRGARAQARLTAHLEETQRKVEGGFTDLRGAVESLQNATREPIPEMEAVFDALDALDEASRGVADQPALLEGLAATQRRLGAFLAAQGFRRHGVVGQAPDGLHCKVVGTDDTASLPDGVVTRVVRAAITLGARVVREGDVMVNRRSA